MLAHIEAFCVGSHVCVCVCAVAHNLNYTLWKWAMVEYVSGFLCEGVARETIRLPNWPYPTHVVQLSNATVISKL